MISTMLLLLAIPYIIPYISPVFTGPIKPDYDDDPNQGGIDAASDKYVLAPYIRYVGNNTDQFPFGENITYSAHAGIYVDGQHRETVDALSAGFVIDCGFHTSGYYTPDEIERMNVGFLCRLIDMVEGTILWTWGGDLKMKDASVFWDDNDPYAKHYNIVDDGFSMTVYLMNNDSGGGLVDNPDPIVDEEARQRDIVLYIGFLIVVFTVFVYYMRRTRKQRQQALRFPLRPINDFDIPESDEVEPTEEELEEIRLENIRKESRLKTLEELIQNITAIKSPQHVLDNTELSIEDFVPEDEREELAFGVLCNLHEEAKERVKRDAIEEDR